MNIRISLLAILILFGSSNCSETATAPSTLTLLYHNYIKQGKALASFAVPSSLVAFVLLIYNAIISNDISSNIHLLKVNQRLIDELKAERLNLASLYALKRLENDKINYTYTSAQLGSELSIKTIAFYSLAVGTVITLIAVLANISDKEALIHNFNLDTKKLQSQEEQTSNIDNPISESY